MWVVAATGATAKAARTGCGCWDAHGEERGEGEGQEEEIDRVRCTCLADTYRRMVWDRISMGALATLHVRELDELRSTEVTVR